MRLPLVVLGLLLGALVAAPASAQSDVATVRLDGQAMFQVSPANEGDNARERARRLNDLLRDVEALGPPLARREVQAKPLATSPWR